MSDTDMIEQPEDELAILKDMATKMGITYSPNIGIAALKKKIEDKRSGSEQETEGTEPKKETEAQMRKRLQDEALKLVRLRITNLNPAKKNIPGEILTIANSYIGTVRKYVPYGETTEDGYHVPYCLYKFMKARKFLSIRTFKDKKTGRIDVKQSWAPEFALEILPPLTQKQLDDLAKAQAAAGSIQYETEA